jgi:hypothetical protein
MPGDIAAYQNGRAFLAPPPYQHPDVDEPCKCPIRFAGSEVSADGVAYYIRQCGCGYIYPENIAMPVYTAAAVCAMMDSVIYGRPSADELPSIIHDLLIVLHYKCGVNRGDIANGLCGIGNVNLRMREIALITLALYSHDDNANANDAANAADVVAAIELICLLVREIRRAEPLGILHKAIDIATHNLMALMHL